MKSFIFYIFNLISISTYGQTDCNLLTGKFSSYREAVSKIENAKFTLKETVNTSRSSWVRSASFYSCDKKFGYFIINTDKHNYIYKNLPVKIWYDFKIATSYGSYFNSKIKNRYEFYLTK